VATGLVIFDCDGVLVDTEPAANRVLAACLSELGVPTTPDEAIRDYKGLSMKRCVELIEARRGRPLPDDFVEVVHARTIAAFERGLQPIPHVETALDRIVAAVCVASSGHHGKMKFTLTRTGLWPRFKGKIFSADDVARGKPAPDLFLRAADVMGFAPAECVVVEDSLPGVQAARAAAMRVLGYTPLGAPGTLAAAGAEVFHDMRALPALLG